MGAMGATAVFVVWAHLIVWDADTGKMLAESEMQMPSFIEHPDTCLKTVLPAVKKHVASWRKAYPNAFANIDCEFRKGTPIDPA